MKTTNSQQALFLPVSCAVSRFRSIALVLTGSLVLASCSRIDYKAVAELRQQGLISSAAEVNTKRLSGGATLLIDAAEKGDLEQAARLLAAGADPDGRGYKVNSLPLTRAQMPEMLELLAAKGADVNASDAAGTTPLGWAASLGNLEGARTLLRHGAEVNPEPPAEPPLLNVSNLGMAAALLGAGADVNLASRSGVTPLMRAASRGNTTLAELYLGAGARTDSCDAQGNTALHVARSADMVELLVRAGASPLALNVRGETALFEIMHDAATVRALVEAGVPLDAVSAERRITALQAMLCDPREDADAILTLIRAGACVTCRTPDGKTTVQQAAARGGKKHLEIIRALMRAGAQSE